MRLVLALSWHLYPLLLWTVGDTLPSISLLLDYRHFHLCVQVCRVQCNGLSTHVLWEINQPGLLALRFLTFVSSLHVAFGLLSSSSL